MPKQAMTRVTCVSSVLRDCHSERSEESRRRAEILHCVQDDIPGELKSLVTCDNLCRHKDFHGAPSIAVDYLHRNHGEAADVTVALDEAALTLAVRSTRSLIR